MAESTIDVKDWEHLCKENARDILLAVSCDMAEGLAEWLNGIAPQYPNLDALGTTIGTCFEREKNEGFSVGQSVCGIVDAATVIENVDRKYHQTDTGQWSGCTSPNENGVQLADLAKTVEAMATSTLEYYVGVLMAECFEYIWEQIESEFEDVEDVTAEQINDRVVDLIGQWD